MLTLKRWIAGPLVIAGLAALIVAPCRSAVAQAAAPALPALIPQNSLMVSSIDVNWLWDTTASIRKAAKVNAAIEKAEAKSHISIEDDIKPWAGQIAFAVLDVKKKSASVIIYAQIRDQIKFMATVAKLTAAWKTPPADAKPGDASPQFTPRDYHGVTVFDGTPIGKGGEAPSFAIVDGWAMAGIGKGSIEHALDVYQGRSPSISADPAMSQVIAKLPQTANAWGVMNLKGVMDSAPGDAKLPPNMPGFLAESANNDMGVAFTDEGKGMRFDIVSAPQTPKGRALLAKMAKNLPGVSGAILKKTPDAVLAVMFTSPAYYWNLFVSSMLETASSPAERKEMQKGLNTSGAPFVSTLPYFHKDAGFVITWRKDRGYGLALLAQGDSHNAALHAAATIAKALKQTGIPLQRGGNSWAAVIPGLDMMVPPTMPFKLAPFISAKDDWLVVGSNPSWLSSTSAPNLQLPANSEGSPVIESVSMQWLPSLLDLVQQQASADDTDVNQGLDLVRSLHLETATASCYYHIDPSGANSAGTAEVTNWDWHAAIDAAVTAAQNWKPSEKKKGHNLLKHDAQLSQATPRI